MLPGVSPIRPLSHLAVGLCASMLDPPNRSSIIRVPEPCSAAFATSGVPPGRHPACPSIEDKGRSRVRGGRRDARWAAARLRVVEATGPGTTEGPHDRSARPKRPLTR